MVANSSQVAILRVMNVSQAVYQQILTVVIIIFRICHRISLSFPYHNSNKRVYKHINLKLCSNVNNSGNL